MTHFRKTFDHFWPLLIKCLLTHLPAGIEETRGEVASEGVDAGGQDQVEEGMVVEEHLEESIEEGQVASGSKNVPLFDEGVELFHAFFWANWRMVAKDLNTGDRKQIFAGVEKLFDSTLAAVNKQNVSVATSPKRPASQYLLFSKEKYSSTAKRVKEGGVASKDVQKETSRELSRIWKAMSPQEREPYAKEAANLKKVFFFTK